MLLSITSIILNSEIKEISKHVICLLWELVMDREAWPAAVSPWGRKESDTTEWLNWTENVYYAVTVYLVYK